MANKLGVTEEYLRHPQAAEVTDNGDVESLPTLPLDRDWAVMAFHAWVRETGDEIEREWR